MRYQDLTFEEQELLDSWWAGFIELHDLTPAARQVAMDGAVRLLKEVFFGPEAEV